MSRDLGDFQTPPELAATLVRRLGRIGERWPRVLEPTCGRGNFLRAALDSPSPPREAIGVELQPAYRDEALAALGARATILGADVFAVDLAALPWRGDGPILAIGNPPWVTNAALGRLGSGNRPERRNVDNLPGLDAMTGASNFDLGEAVWLRLLDALADQPATIAMLCKTTVAHAVLARIRRRGPSASAEWVEVDARRWFGAAVSAGFLVVTLGEASPRVPVFPDPEAVAPARSMGWIGDRLAADFDAASALAFAVGRSPLDWRQGIKHDAAPVMELTAAGGALLNGLGDAVDVEPEYLYPLVKGADLARGVAAGRSLIVPHRSLGEDTRGLESAAPRLWAYLRSHAGRFEARRSSIYRGRPSFCLFGVGPYAFAPYKVAVAGIHRPTRFRAIGPVGGRPVVLDDTCYLLACESAEEAAVLAAVGNDPIVLGLARALAPPAAKRPVTKSLLGAIDLAAVLARADRDALAARAVAAMRDDLGRRDDPTPAVAAEIARLVAAS
ncbi:class I SAM-dependent methyltransferase [Paludisphaera sp.]|uniref:class I SAM-dependent methyltransferase n=1 Tax=Paludisphaera sp. TaxID=2017432 RepID=UPI00301E55EC